MADGLNHARAMRIAELMSDYRNIQNYIASVRVRPPAEEYNEDGYVLLRRCLADAQVLLSQPFHAGGIEKGGEDEKRGELRRQVSSILADAAMRRFNAQRIYLRTVAALRWVNARQAILGGQNAHAGHAAALGQARNQLRAELASITDNKVELSLRQPDESAGKWLDEDPGLALMLRLAGNGSGR